MRPLWIMIAGPYTSGAQNEQQRQANLEVLNRAAWEVYRKGHVPIIGVNNAMPIVHANSLDENILLMPLSLALAQRCDATLRIGGPSQGADAEQTLIEKNGGITYYNLSEIPSLSTE